MGKYVLVLSSWYHQCNKILCNHSVKVWEFNKEKSYMWNIRITKYSINWAKHCSCKLKWKNGNLSSCSKVCSLLARCIVSLSQLWTYWAEYVLQCLDLRNGKLSCTCYKAFGPSKSFNRMITIATIIRPRRVSGETSQSRNRQTSRTVSLLSGLGLSLSLVGVSAGRACRRRLYWRWTASIWNHAHKCMETKDQYVCI